ncbi:MAG: hypothetical protein U0703_11485 [Anaerolineae bacterium]
MCGWVAQKELNEDFLFPVRNRSARTAGAHRTAASPLRPARRQHRARSTPSILSPRACVSRQPVVVRSRRSQPAAADAVRRRRAPPADPPPDWRKAILPTRPSR